MTGETTAANTEPAEGCQPRLTRWAHAWRLLLMLVVSAGVATDSFPGLRDRGWWRIALDVAIGLTAYGVVHLRRRRPLAVAVVTLMLGAVSAVAAGPTLLATVSVATRRKYAELAVVAAVNSVSAVVYYRTMPSQSGEPFWVDMVVGALLTGALIAWGMYIGSRRELLWTLRQRAERAEAERDLRVGKAQADERARIAREMHDVLAHRISQVSMHAGALAYRTDLTAEALRVGIGEVQATANEALTDLRSVLGVLRDRDTGAPAHSPQPTYDDLPALVSDARRAGGRIEMTDRIEAGPLPAALGRTLYRVVQEGITNAQKHAPGALLTIELSGDSATGVDVLLRNPLGLGPPAAPGAALGLVGLAERVALAGGQLRHGVERGAFVVQASLPWTA